MSNWTASTLFFSWIGLLLAMRGFHALTDQALIIMALGGVLAISLTRQICRAVRGEER